MQWCFLAIWQICKNLLHFSRKRDKLISTGTLPIPKTKDGNVTKGTAFEQFLNNKQVFVWRKSIMKKKVVSALLCVSMVAASLVGCGDKTADTTTESATETTEETTEATEETAEEAAPAGDATAGQVYWLNFKPEADEALQQIAEEYTTETGVPVKVVTAASGTYESTLTAEMDKSQAPTLFVVGNQAAVKTWQDYCLDLKGTDIYNELTTDDFTLYNADGKACSIGYCYESFGIITNKKLLEQAGHSVDEITNFETLKAVAEDIHARQRSSTAR